MKDRLFGFPGAVLEGTGMSNTIPNTANWSLQLSMRIWPEFILDVYPTHGLLMTMIILLLPNKQKISSIC